MVDLGFIFFFLILGLSVGSFLNVVINRIPRGESIRGRSFCDTCRTTLAWYDLIPLVSFILLKGHCRYCGSLIPLHYPLVELLTAILFVTVYLRISFAGVALPYYLFMMAVFVVVFFSDLIYGIIPDTIVFPAILASLLFVFTLQPSSFTFHVLSALGASTFFAVLIFVTKGRGMGWGDVKLSALMGLMLGFPGIIVSLYLAFVMGAVISVLLIAAGRKTMKDVVPFGPFLVTSTLFTFFMEDTLLLNIPYIT